MWWGLATSVPVGWHLCDGTHGTPDLQSRFIVAAGGSFDPNDAGGSDGHAHTFTGDGHHHEMPLLAPVQAGSDASTTTTTDAATGHTDSADTRAPYYALCYIMRLATP